MSRDDDRNYAADVEYEVWRMGGNPDTVDRDRCDYAREMGVYPEDHASRLMRERTERRAEAEREEIARTEEEYYRQLEEKDQAP